MEARGDLPNEAGDSFLTDVLLFDRLTAALSALEDWARRAGGVIEHGIDQADLKLQVLVKDVSPDELSRLTRLGLRVELDVPGDEWQLVIEGEPGRTPHARAEGPIEMVVDTRNAMAYLDAIRANDLKAVLEPLDSRAGALRLTYEHPATAAGFHWVASAADLEDRLVGDSWLVTVRQLFEDGGPGIVVAHDSGEAYVRGPGFLVRGPKATNLDVPPPGVSEAQHRFMTERGRTEVPPPPPTAFAPVEGDGLESLGRVLNGIARALVWYWLAHEGMTQAPPVVRFVGTRVAQMTLRVVPSDNAHDELALFSWALSIADPQQDEAIQQAVALAVFSDDDLATAAAPVLRTAKTVLRNIRRDQVSEALATQRAVRESAISAAASAAEAARTAGVKMLERVVVQVAAAAGILIANSKDALPDHVAQRLLLVVSALLVISAVLAFFVEYPMARGILSSFKSDLALHKDTLSEDTLTSLEDMAALAKAEGTVERSFWLSVSIIAVAAIALAVAFCSLA